MVIDSKNVSKPSSQGRHFVLTHTQTTFSKSHLLSILESLIPSAMPSTYQDHEKHIHERRKKEREKHELEGGKKRKDEQCF